MLKPFQYWLVCLLAAAGIGLIVVNAGLYFANRSLQAAVGARAQYIQQTQPIGTLYREIVRLLARLAIEHQDEEVKALLTKEGFTMPAAGADTDTGTKP